MVTEAGPEEEEEEEEVTQDSVQRLFAISPKEDIIVDILLTSGLDIIIYLICSSSEINI